MRYVRNHVNVLGLAAVCHATGYRKVLARCRNAIEGGNAK
jgi:hypothetical protein